MRNILIVLLLLFLKVGQCQTKPIYLFKNRYDKNTLNKVNKSIYDFKEMKIMLGYMIDPNRNESIDYRSVEKYLNSFYPNPNDKGILCIDWENELYQNIRGNHITRVPSSSSLDYNKAIQEFIKLIKFVKKQRPNIDVGVFEIPFRVYGKSEIINRNNNKLEELLSHTDVIFPCIYIPGPNTSRGNQSPFEFLKLNLDIAFEIGDRINKPVIPFFWYLYYSNNKSTRFELIPRDELWSYMKYIENYESSQNNKIAGIIWWDTPTSYSKKLIRNSYVKNRNHFPLNIDNVFTYYFDF